MDYGKLKDSVRGFLRIPSICHHVKEGEKGAEKLIIDISNPTVVHNNPEEDQGFSQFPTWCTAEVDIAICNLPVIQLHIPGFSLTSDSE